ncbi:MAG: AAA family ATPase, partial [Candidatus Eremiobacterota bacterium]
KRADCLQELARWTWCPPLKEHLLNLRFPFKKRTGQCRILVVTLEALGRTLAMSPTLPHWFEIAHRSELEGRTVEAVRAYLKAESDLEPEGLSALEKAWVAWFELRLDLPGAVRPPQKPSMFALLGGADVAGGALELRKVGRCLNHLYPDQLERTLGRERESERLDGMMTRKGRVAVAVVGPRLVGKTALIHEHVRRAIALARDRKKPARAYWHLSPQRLISGMSYVGQWQTRVNRILRHAAKKDLVLVFDDLVGLLLAGVSRDSTMNVAQMLKASLEQQEVRVLAEITPQALAVLRERDRGLADLFEVMPLEETTPRETMSISLQAARSAEASQRCRFGADALLAVEELCRRFVSDAAFPGKSASMLRQLAARYREGSVGRQQVLDQFHQRSGVVLQVLDQRVRLTRQEVLAALRQRIVGQAEAVEACADAVSLAKARLSDPTRPVAGLLFLGPTGVGKTECARALAAYLYGDESRLVRFDMNEYVGYDSVARLVGSPTRPEGQLTGAIRRQPFAVVLLDEVEKAHPDVLQLLLQILGDGRLTDALGRTADFTQCILILTSNLGAGEAGRSLGLRTQEDEGLATTYRRAAESFFSPELFNRLDRIVPFRRLERPEIGRIAQGLMERVLAREGLARRQCILKVHAGAVERLVDHGFHPRMGARALKRAVERDLAVPVARLLAAMPPDTPTVLSVGADLAVS